MSEEEIDGAGSLKLELSKKESEIANLTRELNRLSTKVELVEADRNDYRKKAEDAHRRVTILEESVAEQRLEGHAETAPNTARSASGSLCLTPDASDVGQRRYSFDAFAEGAHSPAGGRGVEGRGREREEEDMTVSLNPSSQPQAMGFPLQVTVDGFARGELQFSSMSDHPDSALEFSIKVSLAYELSGHAAVLHDGEEGSTTADESDEGEGARGGKRFKWLTLKLRRSPVELIAFFERLAYEGRIDGRHAASAFRALSDLPKSAFSGFDSLRQRGRVLNFSGGGDSPSSLSSKGKRPFVKGASMKGKSGKKGVEEQQKSFTAITNCVVALDRYLKAAAKDGTCGESDALKGLLELETFAAVVHEALAWQSRHNVAYVERREMERKYEAEVEAKDARIAAMEKLLEDRQRALEASQAELHDMRREVNEVEAQLSEMRSKGKKMESVRRKLDSIRGRGYDSGRDEIGVGSYNASGSGRMRAESDIGADRSWLPSMFHSNHSEEGRRRRREGEEGSEEWEGEGGREEEGLHRTPQRRHERTSVSDHHFAHDGTFDRGGESVDLTFSPSTAHRRSIAECLEDAPWKVPFRVRVSVVGMTVDDVSGGAHGTYSSTLSPSIVEELEAAMPMSDKQRRSRTVIHLVVNWSLPFESLLDAQSPQERSGNHESLHATPASEPPKERGESEVGRGRRTRHISIDQSEYDVDRKRGTGWGAPSFYFRRSSFRLIRRLDEVAAFATSIRAEYPLAAAKLPRLSAAAEKRITLKALKKGRGMGNRLKEVGHSIFGADSPRR
mmetsp:Transcript_42916/g.110778  ORF Transcript_42916/g.110778 Transcript_42916/m.110778 type:complete len:789 (-) Transcript_42916:1174-3540(-)